MASEGRKFLPTLAELLDRLTVTQIKEVCLPRHKRSYGQEMKVLAHDIDILIRERKLKLSARLIRIIVAMAQLNLHVWNLKEKMQHEPKNYLKYLKSAHQLNGIRNRLKNILLAEAGDKGKCGLRTNFNTDGLKGWQISIIELSDLKKV